MTNPLIPAEPDPATGGPRFGLNVPAFEAAYPGIFVRQGRQYSGFSARLLINGRPKGAEVWARTLDDLAPLVECELGPLSLLAADPAAGDVTEQ